MSQMMSTTTAITMKIPTAIPAWKISPITSQLVSVPKSNAKIPKFKILFFMIFCFQGYYLKIKT